MSTPVSVVIPTYNRAHLLPRAINSVLPQLREHDEIMVIDDGSTDDTASIVSRFRRVRYLKKPRGGAGPARNCGMAEARNPLIAFLDSDDEWLPGKLELQRRLMEALPDVDYCYSDFLVSDRNGRAHRRYLRHWHQDQRSWDVILAPGRLFSSIAPVPHNLPDLMVHEGNLYPQLMEHPYIATFTLLCRKIKGAGAPLFSDDLPIFEDWEFFGRLARDRKGAYLDCETAIQHGHDGLRLTQAHLITQIESRQKIINRLWGSDENFLREHAARYKEVVDHLESVRRFYTAKELLRAGQMREARAAFRAIGSYPTAYRLLLMAPGFVIRAADRVRRPFAT